MKLSDGVEAAIHCAAVLAQVEEGKTLPASALAGLYSLSQSYLLKHLQALTAAKVFESEEDALEAIRDMPEDATVEDMMERLYFLAKIEEGMRQADAGQTVSHEEAKRRALE
jgi:hypothetical protein